MVFVAIPFCFAQPAYVEIKVPVGVRSETMFIRYVVNDDFGGWVQAHPDVSSYFITIRQGEPATRFRALLYAPGCAIQTADLPILGPAIPRYSFVCEPLPNVSLTGTMGNSDLLESSGEIRRSLGAKHPGAQQWNSDGYSDGRYAPCLGGRNLPVLSSRSFGGPAGGPFGSSR